MKKIILSILCVFIISGISFSETLQNAEAYYNSANIKYNSRDYKGAIKDYTEAIKINPKYAEAYHFRGYAKVSRVQFFAPINKYPVHFLNQLLSTLI